MSCFHLTRRFVLFMMPACFAVIPIAVTHGSDLRSDLFTSEIDAKEGYYSALLEVEDCVGIFQIGTDGKYYWRGCSTAACLPDFGECDQQVTDAGQWTCLCDDDDAPAPYCQVVATVTPVSGKIGGYQCLTHNCGPGCDEVTHEPTSAFYPCVCP
jgi:hypothetical protein